MIDQLMNLDRRVIFIFVFLGVTIPLLADFHFPIKATPTVIAVYDEIERVAEKNGRVLLSFSYGGGSEPELQPMARAMIRHLFERHVPFVIVCLWPDAVGLAQDAVQSISSEYGARYGVDYAFMGYKTGQSALIISMGQDFHVAFATDQDGARTDTLEITRNIRSLSDFDFVFDFAAGESIDHWWIPFGQEKYRFSLGGGCTAVIAPDLFPFLQSGQLVGMIGGLAGAAEYETLVGHPAMAVSGMRPQSITHLVIIAFIIMGNVTFFLSRRR